MSAHKFINNIHVRIIVYVLTTMPLLQVNGLEIYKLAHIPVQFSGEYS